MTKRLAAGLALIVISVALIVTAAVIAYSDGLYADATGAGGAISGAAWTTGIGGIVTLVAAIWILQTGPTTSGSDQHGEETQPRR